MKYLEGVRVLVLDRGEKVGKSIEPINGADLVIRQSDENGLCEVYKDRTGVLSVKTLKSLKEIM